MLDQRDQVVRPALIWCDQRTEQQSRELMEKIGADRIIQLTCNPALTNFTVTKLLWVSENEPHHWSRALGDATEGLRPLPTDRGAGH